MCTSLSYGIVFKVGVELMLGHIVGEVEMADCFTITISFEWDIRRKLIATLHIPQASFPACSGEPRGLSHRPSHYINLLWYANTSRMSNILCNCLVFEEEYFTLSRKHSGV